MANILAAMNAGWDTASKQIGDFNNTRLNQLASQAYSAPEEARPGLLGQMARLDRSAAAQQQASFNSGDDRKLRLLTGGAQYMKQALDSNNPAAVNGAWRAVRPALIRAGIATEDSLSQDWDPSYAETVHQVLAMGGGAQGDAGSVLQSQKIGADGYIYNTFRDGRMVNTGIKADRQMWLRDHPGMDPHLVGKDGTVQAVGAGVAAGAQVPAGQPAAALPTRSDMEADIELANAMIAAGIPEAQVDAFLAQRGQRAPAPQAGAGGMAPAAAGGRSLARPSAAQEAAATEAARQQAQLQFLPQELAMRGQAAAEQAAATERAKAEVGREQEAIADLPKVRTEAQNMLTLIDRAIRHPGREIVTGMSGTFDPRSYMPGGQAADFRAILDQLAGSSFLQAFESLKGGGAITEMEGKKAEQARARLQTTQSDEGFLQALRDLREVTQSALQRAERQAAAAQPAPARNATGAVRVQTADDYNRLPAGALYITPSGETRRKR